MTIDLDVAYFKHPLFDPSQLHFETRQTQKLAEVFNRWIWTGAIGGRVLGDARIGKTTALEVVAGKLSNRAGMALPHHIFYVPLRDKSSIASLYRNLCLSVNLNVGSQTSSQNADLLANDFTQYIVDTVTAHDTNTFVLLVDEMQRLTPKQLYAFSELYDLLRLSKINLITFFIGNKQESTRLIEDIEQVQYTHIKKRFFSQNCNFKGLTSKEDIAFCLAQYDRCTFPEGSDISYTQFFMKEDWEKGFRLESLTEEIWTAYCELKRRFDLSDWGMQYFVSTINTLLIDYLPKDGLENFCQDTVSACIDLSGLTSSFVEVVE